MAEIDIKDLYDEIREFSRSHQAMNTALTKSLADMNVILASQQVTLNDHIRRTELLEEAIKPLTFDKASKNAVIKFGAWLIGIGAVVFGTVHLIK